MNKEYLPVLRQWLDRTALPPGRWIRLLLGLFLLILALWCALVLWVDPYLYWHRAIGLKQVYSNSYAMMPGLLRRLDYDTILIGSSLTQNARISDIERACGGKAVKGTSPGLCGEDSRRYFQLAAAGGKLKRVLWNVDPWLLEKPQSSARWHDYAYLYDRNHVEKYLLSKDTFDEVMKVLQANLAPASDLTARQLKNPDYMFANKPGRHVYSRQALLTAIQQEEIKVHLSPGAMPAAERYLFSLVRQHPEIRFDFFLPPYHLYFWCHLHRVGELDSFLAFREHFSRTAAQLPNVRLHDFQMDLPVITAADNYKDLLHFSPAINRYLTDRIAAGTFIAGPEQVREHNRQLRELVQRTLPEYRAALAAEPAR